MRGGGMGQREGGRACGWGIWEGGWSVDLALRPDCNPWSGRPNLSSPIDLSCPCSACPMGKYFLGALGTEKRDVSITSLGI